MFTYFGYSRAEQKIIVYVKFEGQNYKYSLPALHFVPNWTGFFYLKDEVNAGAFQGSTKRVTLKIGEGAFLENESDLEDLAGVSPEPVGETVNPDSLPGDKTFQLKINDKDPAFRLDLPKSVARETNEYRIEFWTKLSLTNPERVVDRNSFLTSGCRQLARAYETDYSDSQETAKKDRMLAVFYCAGSNYQYRFFTYYEKVRDDQDLNGYSISSEFDEMEGVWNYIYIGYSQQIGIAYAGVYFSHTDELKTLRLPAARARGKNTRIGFIFGAGFGVGTINGLITKASVRWDEDAYLSSEKEIVENIDGENTIPEDSFPLQLRFRLIGDGEDLYHFDPIGIPIIYVEPKGLVVPESVTDGEDGENDSADAGSASHDDLEEEEEENDEADSETDGELDGEQEATFDGEHA